MNDQKLEDIKRQLAAVPALPGVYLWKDKKGRVDVYKRQGLERPVQHEFIA